jgi:hypothetical protein
MHSTLLAALHSRPDAAAAESPATTTEAAATYLADRLAPALRRVQMPAAADRVSPGSSPAGQAAVTGLKAYLL